MGAVNTARVARGALSSTSNDACAALHCIAEALAIQHRCWQPDTLCYSGDDSLVDLTTSHCLENQHNKDHYLLIIRIDFKLHIQGFLKKSQIGPSNNNQIIFFMKTKPPLFYKTLKLYECTYLLI